MHSTWKLIKKENKETFSITLFSYNKTNKLFKAFKAFKALEIQLNSMEMFRMCF